MVSAKMAAGREGRLAALVVERSKNGENKVVMMPCCLVRRPPFCARSFHQLRRRRCSRPESVVCHTSTLLVRFIENEAGANGGQARKEDDCGGLLQSARFGEELVAVMVVVRVFWLAALSNRGGRPGARGD